MSVLRKLAVVIVMVTLSLSGNAMSTDKKAVKEYNKALENIKKDKLEKAEKYLLKALKRDANFFEAHQELGIVYYKLDRMDEATAQLTTAFKLGGKNAVDSLEYLYAIAKRSNNLDSEVQYAVMKVKTLGRDATVKDVGRIDALAIAYAQNNQLDKAVALYNQLIELRPDYAYAYLNLGKIYMMEHKEAKTRAIFEKAIENHVDNTQIDFILGGMLHDAKAYKKALPVLNKAAKNQRFRENVLPLLINCYIELKQFPQALEQCQTFLKEFPSSKLTQSVRQRAEKIRNKMKGGANQNKKK